MAFTSLRFPVTTKTFSIGDEVVVDIGGGEDAASNEDRDGEGDGVGKVEEVAGGGLSVDREWQLWPFSMHCRQDVLAEDVG